MKRAALGTGSPTVSPNSAESYELVRLNNSLQASMRSPSGSSGVHLIRRGQEVAEARWSLGQICGGESARGGDALKIKKYRRQRGGKHLQASWSCKRLPPPPQFITPPSLRTSPFKRCAGHPQSAVLKIICTY